MAVMRDSSDKDKPHLKTQDARDASPTKFKDILIKLAKHSREGHPEPFGLKRKIEKPLKKKVKKPKDDNQLSLFPEGQIMKLDKKSIIKMIREEYNDVLGKTPFNIRNVYDLEFSRRSDGVYVSDGSYKEESGEYRNLTDDELDSIEENY
jgi:hypothetical protein